MGHDGGAEGHETTPEVLVVTGPTASGKSSLAVALAERFDGAVVNADSLQVYRDLEILTARPDPAATRRVPHCLYGIMDGAEICSAGHWRGLALAEIERIRAMGRLPIVTGGTGLYLKALTEGLAILPEVPESVRSAARRVMADRGAEAFHRELADRDPEAAARLHPSDRQRLIRAWEVLEGSGIPCCPCPICGSGRSFSSPRARGSMRPATSASPPWWRSAPWTKCARFCAATFRRTGRS